MTPKTLSLNKSGWTSFFSFTPESMTYMDNKLYSFKGGQIYVHDAGDVNSFYGTLSKSSIRTVLNENPTERKVFKTFAINGDVPWSVQMSTDIQSAGYISSDMLEHKEGVWYAHVRVPNQLPTNLSEDLKTMSIRDSIGIGESFDIGSDALYHTIVFPVNLRISSQVCVGDYVFAKDYVAGCGPKYLGIIREINFYPDEFTSELYVERVGETHTPQVPECFIFAVKNRAAESTGIVGQFCLVDIERTPESDTEELFVLEAEVMRSNP